MSKKQFLGRKRAAAKRDIQKVLDNKGIDQVEIAQLAGVTPQAVSATLNGYLHSSKVLEALRKVGVGEKFLFDPKKDAA